jgi:hypothetical protein
VPPEPTSDERTPVTVVEEKAPRTARVGTAALLDAIRAIPDAVAERVGSGGSQSSGEGGAPEVTFVGEAPAVVEPDEPEAGGSHGADILPAPTPDRPRFRHPAARRTVSEAIV